MASETQCHRTTLGHSWHNKIAARVTDLGIMMYTMHVADIVLFLGVAAYMLLHILYLL